VQDATKIGAFRQHGAKRMVPVLEDNEIFAAERIEYVY
jgi:hypothetical protein